jgi:threonine 3-dehydrogenase
MAWKVNMDGSFLLFEAAVAAGVGRLLFPSTLATYGGKLPDPLPEDTPQWPQGLYGMTKVAVERLGVYYHHRFGLDFRGLRLPVIVSPYAPAGAASAYASHAFVQAFQKGAYTFQIRPQTAVSTMYVQDAIRAMVALLRAPAGQLGRRVYNIHALSPTAQEIADAVVGRLPQARLTFHPQPDVVNLIESWPKIIVDTSARQDWAWQPQYDLSRLADDMVLQLRRTQTGEKFS